MDRSVAWRAALLQALTLGVVALALAATLDRAFFEDWGWLAGPGAWLACGVVTGAVLRLPLGWVLAGAGLAGLPSLLTVLVGAHWLGTPVAIALFAWWCGRLAARRARPLRTLAAGSNDLGAADGVMDGGLTRTR